MHDFYVHFVPSRRLSHVRAIMFIVRMHPSVRADVSISLAEWHSSSQTVKPHELLLSRCVPEIVRNGIFPSLNSIPPEASWAVSMNEIGFFFFFSPLQPMAAPRRPGNQWVSTIPLPSFPSFLKMHPPINPAGCISDGRRDLQKHLPKNLADLLSQTKQNCWINSPPTVRNPRSAFSYGNKGESHHGCLPCKSLPWLFCDGDMFGVYDVVGKCPSPLDLTGWRRPSLLSEAASSDDRLFPASLLDGAFKTNGWSFQESH